MRGVDAVSSAVFRSSGEHIHGDIDLRPRRNVRKDTETRYCRYAGIYDDRSDGRVDKKVISG
jgi:hypothetical protein